MKHLTLFILLLLSLLSFNACTSSVEDKPITTSSNEVPPKTVTVTEQSPAYVRAAPAMSNLKMQMDGTWQDTEDTKRMFVIAGDEYYELYEGRQVAKMKFDIYNACPSESGEVDESGHFIWLRTAVDTTCYQITDMDNSVMVLIDAEEGKQIRYERRQ